MRRSIAVMIINFQIALVVALQIRVCNMCKVFNRQQMPGSKVLSEGKGPLDPV